MAGETSSPQQTHTPESTAAPEVVVAEWQEPDVGRRFSARSLPVVIILPAVILVAVAVAVAIWQKDFTYYMTAGVIVAAVVMIVSQNQHPSRQSQVILTNYQIQIGKHSHVLSDLAGFWLETEAGFININLEPKKRSLMPISVLYPSDDPETVRKILLQVVAEVEQRQETFANQINRYFHF
jgi:hypothetical protein